MTSYYRELADYLGEAEANNNGISEDITNVYNTYEALLYYLNNNMVGDAPELFTLTDKFVQTIKYFYPYHDIETGECL